MSNDVDIKIKLQSAQAEAQLAKFAAQLVDSQQKTERAALSTQKLKLQIEGLAQQNQIAADKAKRFNESLDESAKSLKNIEAIAVASVLRGALSSAFSFVATTVKDGITAFAEYESSIIRLAKITDLPIAQQEKLVARLQQTAISLGVSSAALINYATVAASAGIRGEESLSKVAEVLAKIELATPIAGEAGAQAILRILNLTKEGAAGIESFGNVIAQLGDNSTITENQILGIAEELSKVGSVFGLTSTQVLTLSTTFGEVGVEAEVARTTSLKFFTELSNAVNLNTKQLPVFEKLIGLSGQALKDLFKSNPQEAFIRFTKGANEFQASGGNLVQLLNTLEFSDLRVATSLGALITNYDKLEKNVRLAGKELQSQSKLNNEAEKSSASLAAKLIQQDGIFKLISQSIGSVFAPVIKLVTDIMVKFTQILIENQAVLEVFKVLMVAISAAAIIFIAKLAIMTVSVLANTAAFGAMAAAASAAWAAVFAPITLVVAGIAAVLAIVIKLTGGWDKMVDRLRSWIGLGPSVKKNSEEQAAGNDKVTKSLAQQQKEIEATSKKKQETDQAALNSNGKLTQSELERLKVETDSAKKSNKDKEEDQRRHIEEMKKIREQSIKDIQSINVNSNAIQMLRNQQEAGLLNDLLGENTKYLTTLQLLKGQAEVNEIQNEEKKQAKIYEIMKAASDSKFALIQQDQQAQLDLALVEEEMLLSKRDKNAENFATDLLLLQTQISEEELIRAQAAINLAANEEQRALIISQTRKKAADQELENLRRLEKEKTNIMIAQSQARTGVLTDFAQLATAILGRENKAAFFITKAAAAADIMVRGQQAQAGIQATWAWNPPTAAALSTQQAIRTGIQLATVAAQTVGGFEQGGIVPGNSFSGDRLTANVNSGEMILNRQQQQNMFRQLNSGQGNSSGEMTIHTSVVVDGETIARAVSKQVANGFAIGEVQ